MSNTTDFGRYAVLKVLAAMKIALPREQVEVLFREFLAEDVMASEGLESFLAVTTSEGETPTIITVSRLSCFTVECGRCPHSMMGRCLASSEKSRKGRCPQL